MSSCIYTFIRGSTIINNPFNLIKSYYSYTQIQSLTIPCPHKSQIQFNKMPLIFIPYNCSAYINIPIHENQTQPSTIRPP